MGLRYRILRAGLPAEAANFGGDDDPATRHYGAFDAAQPAVAAACLSFMQAAWEGEAAWQLRGMAVAEDWQRTGVGRALLEYAQADLHETSEIRRLWCNARKPAVGFYEKLGWRVASEEFEIPTAGPHFRMTRQ